MSNHGQSNPGNQVDLRLQPHAGPVGDSRPPQPESQLVGARQGLFQLLFSVGMHTKVQPASSQADPAGLLCQQIQRKPHEVPAAIRRASCVRVCSPTKTAVPRTSAGGGVLHLAHRERTPLHLLAGDTTRPPTDRLQNATKITQRDRIANPATILRSFLLHRGKTEVHGQSENH
jgi:hypothetical protein